MVRNMDEKLIVAAVVYYILYELAPWRINKLIAICAVQSFIDSYLIWT